MFKITRKRKKIKSKVVNQHGGTLGTDGSEISNVYAIMGILKNASMQFRISMLAKDKNSLGLCPLTSKSKTLPACNAGCVNSSQASELVKELLNINLIDGYGCWSTAQDVDGEFSEVVNESLGIVSNKKDLDCFPPIEWIWKDFYTNKQVSELISKHSITGIGVENNKPKLYNGYTGCAKQGILDVCNTNDPKCLPIPKNAAWNSIKYNTDTITNCDNKYILSNSCSPCSSNETGYIYGNPKWEKPIHA